MSLIAWFPLYNDFKNMVDVSAAEGTPTSVTLVSDSIRNYGAFTDVSKLVGPAYGSYFADQFTFTAWVNYGTGGVMSGTDNIIMSIGDVAFSVFPFGYDLPEVALYIDAATHHFVGKVCEIYCDTGFDVKYGVWYHLAFEYNATYGIRIYVDGVLRGSTEDISAPTITETVLHAGSMFQGKLSDIRYYTDIFSQMQITALANSGDLVEEPRRGESYQFRIVSVHNNNVYYPRFLTASTNATFPWTVPTANITVATDVDSESATYMSPIATGDQIKLQVAIFSLSSTQSTNWLTLFEGRIYRIDSSFGSSRVTTYSCKGFDGQTQYRLCTSDKTYSGAAISTIMSDICNSFLSYMNGISDAGTTTLASYNVNMNTKYVADVLRELESLNFYTHRIRQYTEYNGDVLSGAWMYLQVLPSSARSGTGVIEGSRRFISAQFSKDESTIYNSIAVYGSSTYAGAASSGAADRHKVVKDATLDTTALCQAAAAALLAKYQNVSVQGSAVILGDPFIMPGDLMPCYLPSLYINGAIINADYRVSRVSHNISVSGWNTSLGLGDIIYSDAEILSFLRNDNRLLSTSNI